MQDESQRLLDDKVEDRGYGGICLFAKAKHVCGGDGKSFLIRRKGKKSYCTRIG